MTRIILGLALSAGLTAPALGAPALRTTPDLFEGDLPLEVDLLADRYLGAVVDTGVGYEVAVLDTDSWELIPGSGVIEPCLPTGESTASTPNAIFAYEVSTTSQGFFIACDGGRLSQVVISDGGDGDLSFEVTSGQLADATGNVVEEALVDGAFLAQSTAYIPYVISRDRIIYTLSVESFDTYTLATASLATFTENATQLAVGPSVGEGSSATFAVALADGSVQVVSSSGVVLSAGCGGVAEDLLIASDTLFVALTDVSGAGVGVVDLNVVGLGCLDFTPLEGELGESFGLGFSTEVSDGTGTLYASGYYLDGSGTGVVSAPVNVDLTSGVADDPIDLSIPGSLAIGGPTVDLAFNLGEGALSFISDAPFVTLTAEIVVEESSSTVESSDDEDATPTSQVITVTTSSLALTVTSDEAGSLTGTFDGDTLDLGETSISAGETLTLSVDLDDVSEGVYPLVIVVTDSDGNSREVTRYLSVDTPPAELAGYTVNFGDGKLIVFWNEPAEDDLAYFEVVVGISEDEDAPFYDGADFLSQGDSYFTVPTSEGTVSWPADIPSDSDVTPGTWPLVYTIDDEALSTLKEDGTRKYRLALSPLSNGVTYYVSVRSVDSGGQEGPWTLAQGAIPETTCGAACQSGESGGFCAIVPTAGPGRFGGWLVALGLLAYFGLRIRRRGDGVLDL